MSCLFLTLPTNYLYFSLFISKMSKPSFIVFDVSVICLMFGRNKLNCKEWNGVGWRGGYNSPSSHNILITQLWNLSTCKPCNPALVLSANVFHNFKETYHMSITTHVVWIGMNQSTSLITRQSPADILYSEEMTYLINDHIIVHMFHWKSSKIMSTASI